MTATARLIATTIQLPSSDGLSAGVRHPPDLVRREFEPDRLPRLEGRISVGVHLHPLATDSDGEQVVRSERLDNHHFAGQRAFRMLWERFDVLGTDAHSHAAALAS